MNIRVSYTTTISDEDAATILAFGRAIGWDWTSTTYGKGKTRQRKPSDRQILQRLLQAYGTQGAIEAARDHFRRREAERKAS